MVGPRIYHIKYARAYPSYNVAQDRVTVMETAIQWLRDYDFNTHRMSPTFTRGSQKGIHVNFVPKYKLYVEEYTDGNYIVKFDYFAKLKIGTAVVVGFLTSGISTAVGVGALAVNLAEADYFVDRFWQFMDTLASGAPQTLLFERWASDGSGNYVQTAPAVPDAIPPMPVNNSPPPSLSKNVPKSMPIEPGQVYGHKSIHLPYSTEPNPAAYAPIDPNMYNSSSNLMNGNPNMYNSPRNLANGNPNVYRSSGDLMNRNSYNISPQNERKPPRYNSSGNLTLDGMGASAPPMMGPDTRQGSPYTRSLGMPHVVQTSVNTETKRPYKGPSSMTGPGEPLRMGKVA